MIPQCEKCGLVLCAKDDLCIRCNPTDDDLRFEKCQFNAYEDAKYEDDIDSD